jgi:hypothetical protein
MSNFGEYVYFTVTSVHLKLLIFLEEQVKLLTEGDTNAARLMRRWERWGHE